MLTSMRPVFHNGSSGSRAAHLAAERSARRLFPVCSSCTAPSTVPLPTHTVIPHVELARITANASCASATASDAAPTTAILTALNENEHSFNGTVTTTTTWAPEAHELVQHFPRLPASESDEPQPVASTSAPGDPPSRAPGRQRRRVRATAAATTSTTAAAPTTHDSGPLNAINTASTPAASEAPGSVSGSPADRKPIPSSSSSSLVTSTPPSQQSSSTAASAQPSSPALPPRSRRRALGPSRPTVLPARPRLRPPPPPLSWPDYPYTRHPVASPCEPDDTAGLKLEALFQCVLHYPRAPPRLLRFLRREVPEGVEGRLAAVTATVERLAQVMGREVAVYLIRRSAWVVLVPAEALAPRMEALRRLLGLQPGAVPDLLRKNPNLLRMQEETLLWRYKALQDALYDAVDFDDQQLRTLVIKYPLILNFKHESVHGALMALRRLCSARPDWTAYYKVLSPSQVAFFMRERVITLLRLEYMLLTGSNRGWTLRDIMKMSNNMFHRAYSGFRSWMQERLRRLRERLDRARRDAEALEEATGEELAPEDLALMAAEVREQHVLAEQERFHRQFMAVRVTERRNLEARMEQRQRTIAEKIQKEQQQQAQQQQQQEQQQQEQEEELRRRQQQAQGRQGQPQQQGVRVARRPARGQRGEEQAGQDVEGEVWGPSRQQQLQHQQQQQEEARLATGGGAGGGGGGPPGVSGRPPPPAGARGPLPVDSHSAAGRVRAPGSPPPPRLPLPAASSPLRGDPLEGVTLGRVWQRPGSKVSAVPSRTRVRRTRR